MPTTSKKDLEAALDEAGIEVRGTELGKMAVGFERWPVGDFSSLFAGLPDDACHAEHWGYVLKGRGRLSYVDGTTETIGAGEVYHAPAGHRFDVIEEMEVVEFTPVDGEYERTVAAFERNLPALLESRKD